VAYRNPQQKGIRREWSRRYGYGGFPMAGGINKQSSRGTVAPNQFRHLENVSYLDPELQSRGGQEKVYAAAQTGCVMGIFEVSGAAGIWIQHLFTNYFEPDRPAPRVSILINPGVGDYALQIPVPPTDQDAYETRPRRAFVIDQIARRLYGFGSLGELFEIVMPEDGTSLANTKLKLVLEGSGAPVYSSGAYLEEMTPDPAAGFDLSDDLIRGALYFGAISSGIIKRWDGVTLTDDSGGALAGSSERQIVFRYQGKIWVASTDYLSRRDGPGSYTALALPGSLATPWRPSAAVEYGNSAYIIGQDATEAVILKLTAPSTVIEDHRIGPPSDYGQDIVDHLGVLHYGWRGDAFNTARIGTFDGTTYTDAVYFVKSGETFADVNAMLSSGDALYTVGFDDNPIGNPDFDTIGRLYLFGTEIERVFGADMVAF